MIEEFTVSFGRGLNIVTGETGAGKSIVLGAFSLLIGERASSDLIRKGADKAVVEAEFGIEGNPRLKHYLIESEIECEADTLIVRREVSARGTSRGFVNDSPASAHMLKELGGYLVDLHGQHEHQSLLRSEHHIVLLDEFGGLAGEVEAYQRIRSNLLRLDREIDELKLRELRLHEEHDLFDFQLTEIATVDPKPNEDVTLESDLRILENSEELRDGATEIHKELYEEDGSVYEKLGNVREAFLKLQKIDASLDDQLREVNSALSIVQELSRFADSYSDRIDLDPKQLESMRQRAHQIQRLKKKYGGTLESVLEKRAELQAKLSFEENFSQIIESKQKELTDSRTSLGKAAAKLTKERKALAANLEPTIVEILRELGIEHAAFQVHFEERQVERIEGPNAVTINGKKLLTNTRGVDNIEFYISTNAGESAKPLVRVASGGEISRIMLALKTILAKNDSLPLLVFDEIDAGISGRVAQRVGRAMKALTAEHQLIAITHLAQIAAFADEHFLVEKATSKGTTTSQLRLLNAEEHAQEVARLISGDDISRSSLENAENLIREASQVSAVSKKSKPKFTA